MSGIQKPFAVNPTLSCMISDSYVGIFQWVIRYSIPDITSKCWVYRNIIPEPRYFFIISANVCIVEVKTKRKINNLPAVRREFPAKGGKWNRYPFSNIPTKCQYSPEIFLSVDPPHKSFSPLYKKISCPKWLICKLLPRHVQIEKLRRRSWLRRHLSSAAAHDSITNHHS